MLSCGPHEQRLQDDTALTTSNPFDTAATGEGTTDEIHGRKRPLVARILISLVWFVPIYLLTNMVIGGILGAFAGVGEASYEGGYAAGHIAAQEFFQNYGLIVLAVQVLCWLSLCIFGLLPGTGKFKRH